MNAWVLVLSMGLMGLLQQWLLKRFGTRGLGYTRRFSKKTAFQGEEADMIEVIRNDRFLFIPWLRAESRISPYLRLGRQENLSVAGERYHKSIFTLRPYQQITRRHRVTLAHRGEYDVGRVSLTAGDLLGFSGNSVELYTPEKILVYPKLLNPEEVPLPVSRFQGDLLVRRHMIADPFLVNGIREYQTGDPIRDIHWPATAKMGVLQVKTHDYTADPRLLVVINAQMSEGQWGELMEYEQTLIEQAISLAATVCLNGLQHGVMAGFAANMPLNGLEEPTVMPPNRHPTRDEELLAAFARLKISRCRNFLSFLDDLSFLQGTDILILSAYTSEAVEEKLEQLKRLGNTVTLYLMEKEAAA